MPACGLLLRPERIKRSPECAIDDDDEGTHHRDPEYEAREVARCGRLSDIGAEAVALSVVSPQVATSATMLAFHERTASRRRALTERYPSPTKPQLSIVSAICRLSAQLKTVVLPEQPCWSIT